MKRIPSIVSKQLLIFVLFLTISKSPFAQITFPTHQDQPTWSVYGSDNVWSNIWQTKIYQYEKDTVMCGYTYSKLIHTSNPYFTDDTINYIRVDGQKVFIKNDDSCSAAETLMYDFSLNVGDTVYCNNDCGGAAFYYVNNISTVNYLGVNRKKFSLNFYTATLPLEIAFAMEWIEGIGSASHPFYPIVCLTDNCETSYNLLCYDSSGTQLYQNPNFSSCYITNIKEKEKSIEDLLIYPNPATNQFTIEFQTPATSTAQFSLYNSTGQSVQTHCNVSPLSNGNHRLQFNTQNLSPGLYLLIAHICTDALPGVSSIPCPSQSFKILKI